MTEEKTVNLIKLLINKTIDRSIRWECTRDEEKFKCYFENASVTIDEYFNRDIEDTIQYLTIFNDEGKMIDQIFDNDDKNIKTMLSHLFKAARGNALKAEETYDKLLSILSQDKIKQPETKILKQGNDDIPF